MNTRFAPSPTGYLHIGGIRTAIFNWALAKQTGGRFILRIDDTDQKRHVDDAVDKICEDLDWLGLDGWRESIIKQSDRTVAYQESLDCLLDKGYAYYCPLSNEDIEKLKNNDPHYVVRYPKSLKECTLCGSVNRQKQKNSGPIRINVVKAFKDFIDGNKIKFNDLIVGDVERLIDDMGDFVIARRDGTFLYNFTTVIDDAQFDISHVVRGQEHLSNTFPQLLLTTIFQIGHPQFAHIPFICAPGTNKKLSKRDAVPATLDRYRAEGYLPDVMFNYLTHLGWAFDGEKEKWSRQEFVDNFSIERISKGSSQVNPEKLLWLQGQYINNFDIKQKVSMAKMAYEPRFPQDEIYEKLIESLGERFRVSYDIIPHRHFFDDGELKITASDFHKYIASNSDILREFWAILKRGTYSSNEITWNAPSLEMLLRDICLNPCRHHPLHTPDGTLPLRKTEVKPRNLAMAVRMSLTGSTTGFGLFDTMIILGKDKVLNRIGNALHV